MSFLYEQLDVFHENAVLFWLLIMLSLLASTVGAPYPARGPDVESCLVTRRDGGRRDPGRGAPRGPKI